MANVFDSVVKSLHARTGFNSNFVKKMKSFDNIKKNESILHISNSRDEILDKKLVIKNEIISYVNGKLFNDVKNKMPRSEFAGIKNTNRKVKTSNNLRNSLSVKQHDSYLSYELPEGKVWYAKQINSGTYKNSKGINSHYITNNYWKKTGDYVFNSVYNDIKKLEKILDIKITKKG